MSRRTKLLIAAVVLADLVLLLVWGLREKEAPPVDASTSSVSDATTARGRELDRPSAVRETNVATPPSSPAAPSSARRTRASSTAPASIQVRGTVYGLDGRALTKCSVGIRTRDGRGRIVETTANHAAGYYLEDLQPGKCTLEATSDGYHDLRMTLDLREDEPVHALDLELQRLDELRVRMLTPDGLPLAARIEAEQLKLELIPHVTYGTREAPGSRISDMQAQELATFRDQFYRGPASHSDALSGLGSDVEGVLYLREPLPAFVSLVLGDTVLDTKHVEADALEVTFVLATTKVRTALTSVRLEVVDAETGSPLAKTAATLDQFNGVTDEKGIVQFQDVSPGVRRITLWEKNHESRALFVHLDAGAINDLGVWRLDADTRVRGRFCKADGEGVDIGWNIVGCQPDDRERSIAAAGVRGSPTEYADHDGRFSARQLGRKKYWIRARGNDLYASPTLVDLSHGSVDDLVIHVVEAVPVTLRFNGDEARYVKYELKDPAEAPIVEGGTTSQSVVHWLGQGSYVARYRIGDDPPKSKSFVVGTKPIEIEVVH